MGLIDLLGPAVNVATNAAGAYQNAQAGAAKEKIAAAVQKLQLDREMKQEQLRQILAQRQDARAQGLMGLAALKQGFVPVAPGDQGQTSPLSEVPMPAGRRYELAPGFTVEHSDELDPYNRKTEAALPLIAARGVQARLTRQTVPGGVGGRRGGALTHGQTRESYILKRIPALTKPTKGLGGLTQPGLSVEDATQRAIKEWDNANGVTANTEPDTPPTTPRTPGTGGNIHLGTPGGGGGVMSPDVMARHRQIDANMQEAIRRGVKPQTAMERANQLHAQVGGG